MSRFGARLRGVQPVADWLRTGGSAVIKSIQRGTITIANGNTAGTATITAVDTANSRLRYLGYGTNDNTNPKAYLTFTNSTTITATRIGNTNDTTVNFEVVEYQPGILRSVQRGTVASGGAGTATITSVVTTKSEVSFLGNSSTDGGAPTNTSIVGSVVLTNATTVTVAAGGAPFTVAYEVAEFY